MKTIIIEAEHLETALEALEFQKSKYSAQLEREPRTRNRVPNIMRIHLLQCLNSIGAAESAIKRELDSGA